MSLAWTEKYRPKSYKEMIGSDGLITAVLLYIKTMQDLFTRYNTHVTEITAWNQKQKNVKTKKKIIPFENFGGKRVLILIGAPGIGKTTVVRAVANDLGVEVIELNASDVRSGTAIEKYMQGAIESNTMLRYTKQKQGKIILFDEADGLSESDSRGGGFTALTRIIKRSRYPIILTANENISKFNELLPFATIFTVNTPSVDTLVLLLQKIADTEKISYTLDDLTMIAELSAGDYRSAVNNLQLAVSNGVVKITDLILHAQKETTLSADDAIKQLLNAFTLPEARKIITRASLSFDDLRSFLDILSPTVLATFRQDDDLLSALESLVTADRYFTRINRSKVFSGMGYIYDELATIGTHRISQNPVNVTIAQRPFVAWVPLQNRILGQLQKYFPMSLYNIYLYAVPLLKMLFTRYPELKTEIFIHCGLITDNAKETDDNLHEWEKLR